MFGEHIIFILKQNYTEIAYLIIWNCEIQKIFKHVVLFVDFEFFFLAICYGSFELEWFRPVDAPLKLALQGWLPIFTHCFGKQTIISSSGIHQALWFFSSGKILCRCERLIASTFFRMFKLTHSKWEALWQNSRKDSEINLFYFLDKVFVIP